MSGAESFDATRWSLVRQAQGDSEASQQALADLCQAYWNPVFRFLRCEGRSEDDARELTQAFFEKLLEGDAIGGADPDRGKFRSYVLGAVKHFLADRRKAAHRLKRGGGQHLEPLDMARESSPGLQVPDDEALHEDAYFDREWANTLLARALLALENRWQERGKAEEFAVMRTWLPGASGRVDQEIAADQLGVTAGAFKVAIHRVRKQFRDAVRAEIAQTVDGEVAVKDELRYLLEIVSQ